MAATITKATEYFIEMLNQKFGEDYRFTGMAGRKNDRVVQEFIKFGTPSGRSVHAFVDRETGDLYKSAGWTGPAKGVRGNVATIEGLAEVAERADRHGGYLYQAR